MDVLLGMEDIIESDLYTGYVKDAVNIQGLIFSLIKAYWYNFDDEVLENAHITKSIRDIHIRIS